MSRSRLSQLGKIVACPALLKRQITLIVKNLVWAAFSEGWESLGIVLIFSAISGSLFTNLCYVYLEQWNFNNLKQEGMNLWKIIRNNNIYITDRQQVNCIDTLTVSHYSATSITIFHNMTCVYILKSKKHSTPVNNYTETYVTCFSRKWKISLNRFSCSYGAQIICFQTKNQNSRDTVPFNLPDSAESRKIQISLKIR